MKIKILLLSILMISVCLKASFAQGEAKVWYFGGHAGIDFNSGVPVALTNGSLKCNEGCASISTSNGSLRFYTNGITVWNNQNNPMPNGSGLLGHSSTTQSVIIVPKPGNRDVYFVFTITKEGEPNGLRYSEVDMTLAGGLGDVTVNKNIPLATPVTEKLTAIKKANNVDIWVIAHDFANDAFLVYSVTSSGINLTPVKSNAGSVDGMTGIGYLKSSTDGSKLVQAINSTNTVDVLNFNNVTGIITNAFSFTPTFSHVYGVEFSPDGKRLYTTSEFSQDIYQYNLTLGSLASILASGIIIGTASTPYLGALQIGPDGKIYVAKFSGSIGCINDPNALGLSCDFIDIAVNLLGMSSTFGLPNFVQSYLNPITYTNSCNGNASFSLYSGIDSVLWNFNDPVSGINNTSVALHPWHVFINAGTYSVSAITHSGTIKDTLTINVVISKIPSVNLGNDIILCSEDEVILDPGSGYENYIWQNSDTQQRDTASAGGLYYVNVSNICGTVSDTILVTIKDCIAKSNDNINLPNIFTPNNDGVNDLFKIQNLPDGIALLKIYNRLGKIVFQSEAYNNDWDGKDANSGVYYYILVYPPDEKTYTGFVELVSK